MKKLRIFLILILFTCISKVKAFDNTVKVYDYAGILTLEEETKLKENINNYITDFNMDMAVVTVNHHEKESTMEYANDFYDYNNFGIGSTKDGLIFVIDFTFGYTDIYISTSGEAIRMYDDLRIDSILDSIAIHKGNYYKMCETFINESYNFAKKGIPNSNEDTEIDENGNIVAVKKFPILQIIIADSLITIIVMLILVNKHKMVRKSVNANYYIDKSSLKITKRSDQFLTTHTSSVRINTDSSGSGYRVGGSSTHISSSGRSHGGGGRRL